MNEHAQPDDPAPEDTVSYPPEAYENLMHDHVVGDHAPPSHPDLEYTDYTGSAMCTEEAWTRIQAEGQAETLRRVMVGHPDELDREEESYRREQRLIELRLEARHREVNPHLGSHQRGGPGDYYHAGRHQFWNPSWAPILARHWGELVNAHGVGIIAGALDGRLRYDTQDPHPSDLPGAHRSTTSDTSSERTRCSVYEFDDDDDFASVISGTDSFVSINYEEDDFRPLGSDDGSDEDVHCGVRPCFCGATMCMSCGRQAMQYAPREVRLQPLRSVHRDHLLVQLRGM